METRKTLFVFKMPSLLYGVALSFLLFACGGSGGGGVNPLHRPILLLFHRIQNPF